MAEFLHILAEQYDFLQLTDEVLRYLPPVCVVAEPFNRSIILGN